MNYDFSSFNTMLAELADKIKVPPLPYLSPELINAFNNLSLSPEISSIQEMAKNFQAYYPELYNSNLTATTIAQAASKAFNANVPNNYDLIKGTVSAIASYAETLTNLNTATSGIDSIVSAVSSALGSLDKSTTSSEEISNDYIDLSEPLADLVQQIDDSIELPEADENNVVRVPKIDRNTVLSVLGIIISVIMALYTIQSNNSNAKLSTEQHNESMQEEQKQTGLLEQIEKNTSTDSNSQAPASTTTQSE